MFKNLTTVLALLLVVVVLWIVFGVYYSTTSTDIDPNAQSYIVQINSRFNTNGFDETVRRTNESLLVSPEVFRGLNSD